MRHRLIAVTAAIALLAAAPLAQAGEGLSPADFEIVSGDDWTGTLTYLDYSTDQLTTIPATLALAATDAGLEFVIGYPDEPWQDTAGILAISSETLDGHPVVADDELGNGVRIIVTEYAGEDNGEPVQIRMVYSFSPAWFEMKKEVKGEDDDIFFVRNTYKFSR